MGSIILNGREYNDGISDIVELTQAEYNALPNSKNSDGILYCISDSTDGTTETVIANPQGTATETLNTIQIGATIYQLPSGGTSFERSSILLTNNANVETTITVTKVE
jgi:hypothetical protein